MDTNIKKMKITKKILIEKVYEKHPHLQKEDALRVVERFFAISKKNLGETGKLLLSGFGSFEIRKKKSRRGRKMQTGETMILAEQKTVTFKLSTLVHNKLNG